MRHAAMAAIVTLVLAPRLALAHSTEPSRSEVVVETREVRWVVRARAQDLAHALAGDRDPVALSHDPNLVAYARSRVTVLAADGAALIARSVDARPEGKLVRLELRFEVPAGEALWLRTRLLADADGEHKDLARVSVAGEPERGFAFGPAGDTLSVPRAGQGPRLELLLVPVACLAGIAFAVRSRR